MPIDELNEFKTEVLEIIDSQHEFIYDMLCEADQGDFWSWSVHNETAKDIVGYMKYLINGLLEEDEDLTYGTTKNNPTQNRTSTADVQAKDMQRTIQSNLHDRTNSVPEWDSISEDMDDERDQTNQPAE